MKRKQKRYDVTLLQNKEMNGRQLYTYECNKCKEIFHFTYNRHDALCPNCYKEFINKYGSSQQKQVYDFLRQFVKQDILISNRTMLGGSELDFLIPDKNIAIEYNGLYFHTEDFIAKDYRLNKTKACQQLGIQLIHIFSDQ